MPKLTANEEDFLTEEERAAIADLEAEEAEQEDGDDAEIEAADAADKEAEGEKPEAGTEGDTAESDEKPAAAEGDEAAEDDAQAVHLKREPVPLIKPEDVSDAEAKLAAIKERKAEMAQKFDDGEMSAREFSTKMDELNDEVSTVREAILKDRLSREITQQQAEDTWIDDVHAFLTDHPEVSGSKLRYTAFDMVVRDVTAREMPKGTSNLRMLQMAHKEWAEGLGIKAPVPQKKDPQPEPAKVEKPKPKLPPSLAHIPAAEIADTDTGKYAALDRLATTDPDAFERRLARMSEAERDEYERMVG